MKTSDIIAYRLANQQISHTDIKTPGKLLSWFGAMQAQDLPMAKWAIGARLPGITEKDIDVAINKGQVLRTHVMRPTWHFVSPDDIYWMLELTGPYIKATSKSHDKQLELTEKVYTRSNNIIEKALSKAHHLTRPELMDELNKAKIKTDEYRSGHLLIRAELDGLICSGPLKGKLPTYALLSERVKKKNTLTREEALVTLAKTYFASHGPATAQDFHWWSGLRVKDVTEALDLIKPHLNSEQLDDETYWFIASATPPPKVKPAVHLLPAFDEYLISYKNRSAAMEIEHHSKAFTNNGIFRPLVVVNGKVVGIWKRTLIKDSVALDFELFTPITKTQTQQIVKAAATYATFLQKELKETTIQVHS
jgi:hypothetical protein